MNYIFYECHRFRLTDADCSRTSSPFGPPLFQARTHQLLQVSRCNFSGRKLYFPLSLQRPCFISRTDSGRDSYIRNNKTFSQNKFENPRKYCLNTFFVRRFTFILIFLIFPNFTTDVASCIFLSIPR